MPQTKPSLVHRTLDRFWGPWALAEKIEQREEPTLLRRMNQSVLRGHLTTLELWKLTTALEHGASIDDINDQWLALVRPRARKLALKQIAIFAAVVVMFYLVIRGV